MKTLKTLSVLLLLAFSISIAKAQDNINNINTVALTYLGVKNALLANNGKEVKNGAKNLLTALTAPEYLKADQQKFWNSYVEKLKADAKFMSQTTNIEQQRDHFAELSKNLYEVLKALKLNKRTVYMQYCPMKKAYWLSETAAIKNPYYSDKSMATCGKTAATLAGVK
jgi:hypothetical protein